MNIGLDMDTRRLQQALGAYAKQLPFAVALALNRTAEEAQQAVRSRIRQRGFVIRSALSDRWLANQIKIPRGGRATKQRPEVILEIASGSGSAAHSILPLIDTGGQREGTLPVGTGTVFGPSITVPLRSHPTERIARSLYPVNNNLVPRRTIAGGFTRATLQGKRHMFALPTGDGAGVVFQRLGPGRADIRPLFWITGTITIPGRHFFRPVVERTWTERFPINLAAFMAHALRTAR
jgi:hypothetical protein